MGPVGHGWKEEPRNLVEAALHEGAGARVLYVANIHDRAVRATVTFRDAASGRLEQVGGDGLRVDVVDGSAVIAVDRKSTVVFRLVE